MTLLLLLLGVFLPVLSAAEAPSPEPRPLQGLTTEQAQFLVQRQSVSVGGVAAGRLPAINQVTVRLLSDPEFLPQMARLGSDKGRARLTLFCLLLWGGALAAGLVRAWRGGSARRRILATAAAAIAFPPGVAAIVAAFYHRYFALLFRLVWESVSAMLPSR